MKSLKAELIPKFKLEFRLFSVLLTAVIPVLQEQDHATTSWCNQWLQDQLPWETQTKNCGRRASYITEDSFISLFLLGKIHKTKENNFLSVVSRNQVHTDPCKPIDPTSVFAANTSN